MVDSLSTLLFNGISYGVLLFLMSVGLSVTMGLMRFANMAHVVFAMLGGYVTVTLLEHTDLSFYMAVVLAAFAAGLGGAVAERIVFRHFYKASELRQVLMSISIIFMSIGVVTYFWGSSQQSVTVPDELIGMRHWMGISVNAYRLLLIAVGALLMSGLLVGLKRTRFGAMLRAAVDNRRMTISCGVDVDRLFFWAFTMGCVLAGLGGALSVNLLGLDPTFGLRYLAYILFVVVVGGMGSIGGSLLAALLIGLVDVSFKYYWPEVGGFVIYIAVALCLILRPDGLLKKG
ncbi:MAG TPA: branched-chain amino acid ABC transporter permease [Pusillimonas sp.]|nr:branched-chain amino acid ABC transporter permease [Pusillimonas sp.]